MMGAMEGAQSTDPEAWLDRHGDSLYRYAMLRLRAPEVAADLVQETFLDAFRTRGSFAGRASERTWLVGILKHKIIDHFRRSGRERLTWSEVAPEAAMEDAFDRKGNWRATPASWAGDPSRVLETQEFWDVFGGCLSKLPEGLARAFCLREMDGLGADEVREVLGISATNLWARLHRSRSLLRQCLESGWFARSNASRPRPVKGASHP